jgi:ferredoxin
MPKVTFADHGKSSVEPGDRTLLQIGLGLGIDISHVCEGRARAAPAGSRSSTDGRADASMPDEIYKEMEPPYRLSCQCVHARRRRRESRPDQVRT